MSTLTIQLPESLKNSIQALADKEGYTVSQFLATGRRETGGRADDELSSPRSGSRARADFENYLSAVPNVAHRKMTVWTEARYKNASESSGSGIEKKLNPLCFP